MILITGAPRSGTHFTAKLLREGGREVEHEVPGKEGTVTWCPFPPSPYSGDLHWKDFDTRIKIIRDPLVCINSLLTIQAKSWKCIYKFYPGLKKLKRINRAGKFWVLWNQKLDKITDHQFKIETLSSNSHFKNLLNLKLEDKDFFPSNVRKGGKPIDLKDLDSTIRKEMEQYTEINYIDL